MSPSRPTRRRTRAVDDAAKQERRASLLRAAGRLLATREYRDVAVADIARTAGLAKGTIYLYFDTKEGLFLDLLDEQLSEWSRDLAGALKRTGPPARTAASAVASSLATRPLLVRLLGLLHVVLERNVDVEVMKRFKRRLLTIIAEPAAALDHVLRIPGGSGVRVLLWTHAFIVGLSQMATPSVVLAEVLDRDASLGVFRLDFCDELEAALEALFIGLARAPRAPG